ncbi:MAG: (Fe-S)-binding protein [Anaerolineales bacterium]
MPIQLFATCLIDSLFPEVGEAVVEVLRKHAGSVAFPTDQTCCGQPAYNAGFHDEARRMAQHTIEVLEKTEGPIVVPSGSCAAMIRHGYLELFAHDGAWLAKAQALADRTYEFSQFLVDVQGIQCIDLDYPARLSYHPSCHLLRGLNVHRQPLSLLQSLHGVQVHTLSSECCGFGGVFAVDHEPISSEMLARRLQQIEASDAEIVVACDVSCLMHIEGGLRKKGSSVRCAHLAQILAGREAGLR